MAYNNLNFVKKESYGILYINRPDKLNALNIETFSELDTFLDLFLSDKDLKGLIITGTGEKSFVAGADISELATMNSQKAFELSTNGQRIFNRIMSSEKPILAAINGFALGGGLELAMSCHFRYASSNAKFGQPEVKLGLIPGYAGTQRLSRLVGKGNALELLLAGGMVDSNRAEKMGLVNQVLEQDILIEKTEEKLKEIINLAPLALKAIINTVNNGENMGLLESQEYEASLFGLVHASDDAKEGCKAFLEKRKAEFKGQ